MKWKESNLIRENQIKNNGKNTKKTTEKKKKEKQKKDRNSIFFLFILCRFSYHKRKTFFGIARRFLLYFGWCFFVLFLVKQRMKNIHLLSQR